MRLYQEMIRMEKKNNYSFYLAVFRVFICLHLAKTIFFQWPYLDILYGPQSFISPTPTVLTELLGIKSIFIREHYQAFIVMYLLIIVLYLFGIGKHFTALVLFLFYETIQRLCNVVLNGGDNFLRFVVLYMVFANSYEYFSIRGISIRDETLQRLSNLFSNLAVRAVTIHFCIVYFWSAFHKIHADVWFNGVATYYILSLARFKGTPWNDLLVKNGYFVTLSTYFTLLVEMYFPALVWFRKTRVPIVVCGIALHLGIYIFMMIYGFEIIFILTYGFFFNDKAWLGMLNKVIGHINSMARWKIPAFTLPDAQVSIFKRTSP